MAALVRAARAATTGTLLMRCCGWRDLLERFGEHQAVKRRYYRWIERGPLDKFLAALTTEADLEWLMIGSSAWSEFEENGTLIGETRFDNGDESSFTAKGW